MAILSTIAGKITATSLPYILVGILALLAATGSYIYVINLQKDGLEEKNGRLEQEKIMLQSEIEGLKNKRDELIGDKEKFANDLKNANILISTLQENNRRGESRIDNLIQDLKDYKFELEVQKDKVQAQEFLRQKYIEIIECIEAATGLEGAVCVSS